MNLKKIRSLFNFRIIAVIALSLNASAHAETLWRIGAPDGSCREFAHAGDYANWSSFFPNLDFKWEGSGLEARWPWILPGPNDAWAGSKPHPISLRFDLKSVSAPAYRLTLAFVAAQASGATLKANVNGRTGTFAIPPGPGDGVLASLSVSQPYSLSIPLAPEDLRKGENRLTLAIVSGSWAMFDSLSLDTADRIPPIDPNRFKLTPTILLTKRNGQLMQILEASALGAGGSHPSVEVRIGDKTYRSSSGDLSSGDANLSLEVPAVTKPTAGKAIFRAGGGTATKRLILKPVRKWKIFVAAETHLDVGYTNLQSEIVKVHSGNLDRAIDLCEKYPGFKWNVEGAWELKDFLKTRSPERIKKFVRLAKAGRIGVEAIHANLLTGLLSDEELFRALYYSHSLSKTYGFPIRSATSTDVPSQVGTLPSVLANCGIRYLSLGINEDRGPILSYGGLNGKSPVWWEGPDGARVLTMFHAGYAQGSIFVGDLPTMERNAESLVQGYDRHDYPYDAIHLHGAFSDNQGLDDRLASSVDAWNKTYAYPKIILSLNSEFFAYIEKIYGKRIPVVKGCGGSYWEDGAGSSANETKLNRNAHEKAVAAETLLALRKIAGEVKDYPTDDFRAFWNDTLLYDEHTWGAYNSISEPESPFVTSQFDVKAGFAKSASSAAEKLLKTAMADLPKPEPVKKSKDPTLADVQRTDDSVVLENRFYKLTMDAKTGGLTSLYDKETKREWADSASSWKIGQILYAEGSNNRAIHPDLSMPPPPFQYVAPTCEMIYAAPDHLDAILKHPMFRTAQVTIALPSDEKRIDFTVDIDKKLTYDKEAVYVAFPFVAAYPAIDYAIGDGVIRAGRDWLPGSCKDWFSGQNWVRVRDGKDADLVWSSPDAPLFELEGIQTGQWLKELPIANGSIFSYALNNYWHTNYKAGQEGDFVFRYSLTSGEKLTDAAAYRFGRSVANPEFAQADRYAKIEPSTVALQSAKVAEDGEGYVFRFRELEGVRATAKLTLLKTEKPVKSAWICNGLEEKIRAITPKKDVLEIPISPRGIATVRVVFEK